ncbi:hypothetical protein Xtri_22695 [Xanthomonas campestris pv. trichodesmae]|uniref:Uncharacterized protein n=3 Tax=Xanthomonas citri TaxID=346 RepID=A0AB33CQG7_XANCI|nr:hypothetical protein XcvCFBP7111P_17625 [Xanthomonas citri pv. vignicola]MBZ3918611.1 hypothetical protein [Xanthomonas campestris pv. trichodesmae]MBZ3926747.1 hypothetical protein [Xanthomonas citri pv. sesbaniae]
MQVQVTRRRRGVFCFMAEEIALRVKEQRFYLDQSKARLLSPFASIEAEADAIEKECLENPPDFFAPENSDMSMVYEAAFHRSLEHYDLLLEMRERTLLGIAAGMYHHFEKSFRVRVARELRQSGWVIGKKTRDQIWRSDWSNLEALLLAFGWDVPSVPRYQDLEALRLVVNVFKHGEGQSFEDLKQRFPRFIPELESGDSWGYVDYTHLCVIDEHLDEFSEAIVSFWEAIPLQLSVEEGIASLNLPGFYSRAMRQDGCPTVAAGPPASTSP